jgi:hypothetical protein
MLPDLTSILRDAERLTLELQDAAKRWDITQPAPPGLEQAEQTLHELFQAVHDLEWLLVRTRVPTTPVSTKEKTR